MNLARRFNAGDNAIGSFRRVATIEFSAKFQASLRDAITSLTFPGLERPG